MRQAAENGSLPNIKKGQREATICVEGPFTLAVRSMHLSHHELCSSRPALLFQFASRAALALVDT